jgi:hypothetical protein
MTDNVPISAGLGTTVATDDVSGVHYQRVKLVSGTLDSTVPIKADATTGALEVIDFEHHEIHDGSSFTVSLTL